MRQSTGEAEKGLYEGTKGKKKKERNTVSYWGLKKRGKKEKRPGQGELFLWEEGTAAASNPDSYAYLSSS